MDWHTLLTRERLGKPLHSPEELGRSPFHKDHDRIIFSGAFRRLGRKTQVHPVSSNDHIHTRLTHSLEVSCVGRSLAMRVGEMLREDLPHWCAPSDLGMVVQWEDRFMDGRRAHNYLGPIDDPEVDVPKDLLTAAWTLLVLQLLQVMGFALAQLHGVFILAENRLSYALVSSLFTGLAGKGMNAINEVLSMVAGGDRPARPGRPQYAHATRRGGSAAGEADSWPATRREATAAGPRFPEPARG